MLLQQRAHTVEPAAAAQCIHSQCNNSQHADIQVHSLHALTY